MKRSKIITLISNPFYSLVLLLLLFTAIAINPYNAYDEGLWTYIGWLYNDQGIPPYTGAVENKTPGIFFLYTVADNFGNHNILFVRGIGVLFTLATVSLVYLIGKKISNIEAAVMSMWIFGLVVCWRILDGFAFAQTETFMIFFSTLAVYLVVNFLNQQNSLKLLFFAGLSLGMAINFKQIAVSSVLGLLLVLFFLVKDFRSYIKYIIVINLGIILAIFFCYVILFFSGVTFNEYIEGAWLILLKSGSSLGEFTSRWDNFFNVFIASKFVLLLGIVVFFFIKRNRITKSYSALLFFWFLFDFIGVNTSGYYYGHQVKQILPAISIISGIVIIHSYKNRWISSKSLIIGVLICFVLFPWQQLKISVANKILPVREKYQNIDNAVSFIKDRTNPEDLVYMLGGDMESVLTFSKLKRRSSSKYFHAIFINGINEQTIVFNDLKANPPKYIIRHKDFIDLEGVYGGDTAHFIRANYRETNNIDGIKILTQVK
jgi:hypothetical protein